MTKNTKGFIAVVAIAVVATSAYVAYKKFVGSKNTYAKYLIKWNYTSTALSVLLTFGEDYLKAWYKAAKEKQPSFSLNGANYNTQGGKKL